MANYVMKGYQTPAGVTDTEDVRKVQHMLGVKEDGVWGPQTQKAYDARMRDVSPAYNQGGSQYKKVLGISDPAFSDGDQFVNYAEYLKNLSGETNKPANNRSVVEDAVRLRAEDESSKESEEPEWLDSVSSFLPSPYAKTAEYNPYPVSSDFIKNDPTREDVEREIANSMGGFRLAAQISDEKNKRRENEKKASEIRRKTVDKYGLDSGTMPVSQYGGHGSGITYPVGSTFPANAATPLELLAQRQQAQQFANSMGVFRQAAQISDEKNKRHENEQKVLEVARNTVDKYGLDSGTMPVSQFYNTSSGLQRYTEPYTNSTEPVDSREFLDAAESGFEIATGLSEGIDRQAFGTIGGALDWANKAIGYADLLHTGYEDITDEDKKLGIKTLKKASGMLGSNIGSALGTILVLAAGTAIGISTGGIAILAVAGALAGGSLGGDFFENMAQTAYDRFTNPDPEGTAIKMANARYMIDNLAQYANDNRLSSSMPYPAFYDGYTPTQSYLP